LPSEFLEKNHAEVRRLLPEGRKVLHVIAVHVVIERAWPYSAILGMGMNDADAPREVHSQGLIIA
jgi:hypothetical protein